MNSKRLIPETEIAAFNVEARKLFATIFQNLTPVKDRKFYDYFRQLMQVIFYNDIYLSSRNTNDYSNHLFFKNLSKTAAKQVDAALANAGLVIIEKGIQKTSKNTPAKMTKLIATQKLLETALYAAWAKITSAPSYVERDFLKKETMERDIWIPQHFNDFLTKDHSIDYKGFRRKIVLRRISYRAEVDGVGEFNKAWTLGGRFYATSRFDGFCFQSLSKDERLKIKIDGEEVSGLDYKCMQPRILYNHFLKMEMAGDAYMINHPKSRRELNKILFFYFMAGKTTVATMLAGLKYKFGEQIESDAKLFDLLDSFFSDFAGIEKEYLQAFIDRHSALVPIINSFQNSVALITQNLDSELLLNILNDCLIKNIPVLPVHDEIIAKKSDAPKVRAIMEAEYFKMFGFAAEIKAA